MENLHSKKYSICSIRSIVNSDSLRDTCLTDISNSCRMPLKGKSLSSSKINYLFPVKTEGKSIDSEISAKKFELAHLSRVIESKKVEKEAYSQEITSLTSRLIEKKSPSQLFPKKETKLKPENPSLNFLIIGQKLQKLKDYEARLAKKEAAIDSKISRLDSLCTTLESHGKELETKLSSVESTVVATTTKTLAPVLARLTQASDDSSLHAHTLATTQDYLSKRIEHEFRFYRDKMAGLLSSLDGQPELLKSPSFKF